MRDDLYLLELAGETGALFFRHYEWTDKTITYGRFQQAEVVRHATPPEYTIYQRPTGGGVVNHSNDWTYSIIVPASHPKYRQKATDHYKEVHMSITEALRDMGKQTMLYEDTCNPCAKSELSLCFQKPARYDVVLKINGQKMAGAAQKRSKYGILTQGSLDKAIFPELDWVQFEEKFLNYLAQKLETEIEDTTWAQLALNRT